ncbi:MAG: sphingosine kinase [Chloroflexi bacterium]|nr:MAG: sphingosine kinase [Chloroflexota bacterium]
MNIVVVYNGKSGSALPKSELEQLFTTNSIAVDKMIDITVDADSIKQHATKGTVIAAVGGDGTISSVADMLHNTDAILAPLPGGTLNHFTKDIGVDQDLGQAIRNLLLKRQKSVDLASVNKTVFINNSSIGLYPTSVREREQLQQSFGKWPSAVVASIKAFVKFKHYSVTINGQDYQTPFVFIGNNLYDLADGARRTSLSDGKLCVYLVASNKRSSLLKIVGYALFGSIHESEDLLAFQSDQVTIHAKKSFIRVSRDGETGTQETPLVYKSLPQVLNVLY